MKALTIAVLVSLVVLAVLSISSGQTPAAERSQTHTYEVDPVHSSVVFRINHLGVSYFYGRINGAFGSFDFDPDNPLASSFEIRIRTKNVDTNNPRRDGHLKTADFFNAKQFTDITFTSTGVAKKSGSTYRVTGDLTLHGVKKSITIDLDHVGCRTLPRRGDLCGFETTFAIKRSDFGMTFMPEMLGDEVRIMIGLEGQKK